jgi:hypothetical protein
MSSLFADEALGPMLQIVFSDDKGHGNGVETS